MVITVTIPLEEYLELQKTTNELAKKSYTIYHGMSACKTIVYTNDEAVQKIIETNKLLEYKNKELVD